MTYEYRLEESNPAEATKVEEKIKKEREEEEKAREAYRKKEKKAPAEGKESAKVLPVQ